MRTISDFLGRKGVASTSVAYAVPASARSGSRGAEEVRETTLADIGTRVGEDNETLRNLLIDTDRRIGALDDLKAAFRSLVEPIGAALQALEQEKTENFACATRSRSFVPVTTAYAVTTAHSNNGRRNWRARAKSFTAN